MMAKEIFDYDDFKDLDWPEVEDKPITTSIEDDVADDQAILAKKIDFKKMQEDLEENEDEVECGWCNELWPKEECRKEVHLGWLCPYCQQAIKSRGERLTFQEAIDDPDDFDIGPQIDEFEPEIPEDFVDDTPALDDGKPDLEDEVPPADLEEEEPDFDSFEDDEWLDQDFADNYDNFEDPDDFRGKCEECGAVLNDMGKCPYCDYGDEEVLDEANAPTLTDEEAEKLLKKADEIYDKYDDEKDYYYLRYLFDVCADLNADGEAFITSATPSEFEKKAKDAIEYIPVWRTHDATGHRLPIKGQPIKHGGKLFNKDGTIKKVEIEKNPEGYEDYWRLYVVD